MGKPSSAMYLKKIAIRAIFCDNVDGILSFRRAYFNASYPGVNYHFGVICELEKGNLRKILANS